MKSLKPDFLRKSFGLQAALAIWFGLLCPGILSQNCYSTEQPSIILSTESPVTTDTTKWYNSLHFSNDQRFLLATSVYRIDIWNIETGKIIRTFSPEDFGVNNFNSISVTNDLSKLLFVHSGDYDPIHAIMADLANGDVLWQIESEPSDYFTSQLYLPSGGYTSRIGHNLLAADGKTAIIYFQWDKAEREYIWADGQTGIVKNTFPIEDASPIKIFNDNRRILAAGGGEQPFVRIYDLNDGKMIQEYPNAINAILTSDERNLYVSNPEKDEIRVYNTDDGEMEKQFGSLSNLGDDFQITPYGSRILYEEAFMCIGRLDYDAKKETGTLIKVKTLIEHPLDINTTSHKYGYVKGFSIDGKYAYLVIRETNTIWLWDLEELGLSGVKQGEEYR